MAGSPTDASTGVSLGCMFNMLVLIGFWQSVYWNKHSTSLDTWIAGFLVPSAGMWLCFLANFGLYVACKLQTDDRDELMEKGFFVMLTILLACFVAKLLIHKLSRNAKSESWQYIRNVASRCLNLALNFSALLGGVGSILDSQDSALHPKVNGFRYGCHPEFEWSQGDRGEQLSATTTMTCVLAIYAQTCIMETFFIYLVVFQGWTALPSEARKEKSLWTSFFFLDMVQLVLDFLLFVQLQPGACQMFQLCKLVHSFIDVVLDDSTYEGLGLE